MLDLDKVIELCPTREKQAECLRTCLEIALGE